VASAVVASACAAFLVVDHALALSRAPREKALIVELEERARDDAGVVARLHDERKQQTDASRARDRRGRALAWTLLVAGALFVASGRWATSLRPPPAPALSQLVAVRLAPPRPARASSSTSPPASPSAPSSALSSASSLPLSSAPSAAAPSPETDDVAAVVDDLVARFGRSREAAVPILQAVQARYRHLPDEVLKRVCERTEITPAQIAGTSSFYARFRRSPVGRHVVRVCHGTACHVAGAEQITQELRRHLGIPHGADTDPQRLFTLDEVACIGCCSLAPVLTIEDETAGRLTPATARQALDAVARQALDAVARKA
jgi:NADH:ubiquinone oxidoreductase subunit E